MHMSRKLAAAMSLAVTALHFGCASISGLSPADAPQSDPAPSIGVTTAESPRQEPRVASTDAADSNKPSEIGTAIDRIGAGVKCVAYGVLAAAGLSAQVLGPLAVFLLPVTVPIGAAVGVRNAVAGHCTAATRRNGQGVAQDYAEAGK